MMLRHPRHPELAARIDRACRQDLRLRGTTRRSTVQAGTTSWRSWARTARSAHGGRARPCILGRHTSRSPCTRWAGRDPNGQGEHS
ncbi:hypothetical protein QJS66_00685 [Kocuria rhizophila]|nr:hypothetical protein QJS66_00685 [Kocuria rhizophila]